MYPWILHPWFIYHHLQLYRPVFPLSAVHGPVSNYPKYSFFPSAGVWKVQHHSTVRLCVCEGSALLRQLHGTCLRCLHMVEAALWGFFHKCSNLTYEDSSLTISSVPRRPHFLLHHLAHRISTCEFYRDTNRDHLCR